MKKMLTGLLVFIFSVSLLHAQAYEDKVKYNKQKQDCIAIDYNYSSEAVQNAFDARMLKAGYKGREEKGILNSDKGFVVYKNVALSDISSDRIDYIVWVDRQSRRNSDISTLYLILQKDGQNILHTMPATDAGKAKTWLNNMIPDIEAANLEIQIKDQQDVVTKAEKKLSNLKDDQISLEKKLKQNKEDQDHTQADIDNQKKVLDNLISRRKQN
jgi:hypothetical protein